MGETISLKGFEFDIVDLELDSFGRVIDFCPIRVRITEPDEALQFLTDNISEHDFKRAIGNELESCRTDMSINRFDEDSNTIGI